MSFSGSNPCNTTCADTAYDTTSYLRTWGQPISDDSVKNPYSTWTYQSAATLRLGRLTCGHGTYPGGGYVVAIRTNRRRMMRLLLDLEEAHWLNNNTRAVLVQFTTFNPTTGLFTISLLAFEFLRVGVVSPYHDINTCKLYSFTNMRDAFTIICEVCYMVLILLYFNRAIRSFLADRSHLKRYLLSVWTYVDWIIIALVYAAVAVFVLRVMAITDVVSASLKHRKRYVSFKKAASYESVFSGILAASIAMFVIKTTSLTYVSKHTLLQTTTLTSNIKYIAIYAVGICVTVCLMSIVSTFLYGTSCGDYSRSSTSFMATLNIILFKANISENGCIVDSQVVDLVFYGVVVLGLLPLMMCVAFALVIISTSGYQAVHVDEKIEFVHFLFSRLLLMLGFWNINEYTEHMKYAER